MRRRSVAGVAVALAVVLAGCGSDKSGSDTAAVGDAGSASDQITATAAGDTVAKLTDPESELFDYTSFLPTEKVAPRAGARIAVVTAALSSPVAKQYATAVIDAAKVAGFKAQAFDGKFQVETQSALIEQAVQQKYDGIVLVGVVPDTIVSALAAAKTAGIPVVSYDGYGDADNGVTDIGIDPAAAGVAVANWIIADSGGKAKALAVTFPPGVSGGAKSITQVGQEALVATLKKCAGCTVKTQDIALTDVVAPGSPAYVNTLRKYTKASIDYVAGGCDTCMVVFSRINTQLGRTELKVTGGIAVGGTGLAEIASGENKAMVAPVQPDQLIALLAVDALARRLDGQTVANMTKLPEPLVTANNAGKFPGATFAPATDYVTMFRNLWKS
ncbi:sugar ABC transporter substrate-binding protein [Streptomyces sp. NPDC055722]